MAKKRDISIEELLTRGVEQVIVRQTLEEKLASKKKLKIYMGIDPTGSDIHLGHSIALRKLRDFVEMGHEVIFLVGNFTALIGDTSDKEAMRKMVTQEEVEENFKTYQEQASKILDFKKVKIKYNNDWLGKLSMADVLKLAQQFTVQQMIERDMYQKRLSSGKPIGLHEFLYPLMQGYDAVAMDVDVEVGGNDQTFNMLAGRTLQRIYNKKEKHMVATTLLEGTDGRKMTTTYGNVVNLTDEPGDMFGKIMSVTDDLIIKYFTLCTDVPLEEVEKYEKAISKSDNPMEYKVMLAKEIVTMYHSEKDAEEAASNFKQVFSEGGKPDKVDQVTFDCGKFKLFALLEELRMVDSRSEAKRMIEQGAVRMNDEKVETIDAIVDLKVGEKTLLQVGKRKWLEVEGVEMEED
ncbi:MAG: tyrosine--tRNA ligase [Candidatus Gracilibacteria bacterium]|nr:tyrosine--tRNA ligase [Candidatus Gracilibacteria bacterium]